MKHFDEDKVPSPQVWLVYSILSKSLQILLAVSFITSTQNLKQVMCNNSHLECQYDSVQLKNQLHIHPL